MFTVKKKIVCITVSGLEFVEDFSDVDCCDVGALSGQHGDQTPYLYFSPSLHVSPSLLGKCSLLPNLLSSETLPS